MFSIYYICLSFTIPHYLVKQLFNLVTCKGESGIRTHGYIASLDFKSSAIDHSAISPYQYKLINIW